MFFPAVDNVLKRMTIIGEILWFRSLAQEGLREVSDYTENTVCFLHAQPEHSTQKHSFLLLVPSWWYRMERWNVDTGLVVEVDNV